MTSGLRKPFRAVARSGRRLRQAYLQLCAREDCQRRGLSVPSGVWYCESCGQTFLEGEAFAAHSVVGA